MDPLQSKVCWAALYSRLLVFAASVVANLLIPDHDAGVFLWTVAPEVTNPTKCDWLVSFLTEGLTRWDGQYFLHIANNGYTYENTLAFFPLYPMVVRLTAEVLYWMQVDYGLVHFDTTLKMASLLVSSGFFVLAAGVLYDLSRKLLRDEYLAYKAALFFCMSPATVFFSASYSESLHAFLTFKIMASVEKGFSFKLGILLALSSATRSNSLLNYGFVAYKAIKLIAFEISYHQKMKESEKGELSSTIANILGDAIVPAFFSAIITLLPFGLFQWYGFTQYCSLTRPNLTFSQNIIDYAGNHSLKLPSKEPSPWCDSYLPTSYNYIQSHYWDVGFLRYFQFKQIPNFVLAAPILYIIIKHSIEFFRRHKAFCKKLGLEPTQQSHLAVGDLYHLKVLPKECFIYVAHAFGLAVFALLCVHVQVSTRLLASSSPVIYWLAAVLTTPAHRKPTPLFDPHKGTKTSYSKVEREENLDSPWMCVIFDESKYLNPEQILVQKYFIGYSVLGTILFANFLPWT